jgi:uncharacterized protein YndB with AHSA1/START domain
MTAQASSGTAKVTLPSDTSILITREFDAPAHLLYRVWTTPDLVRRWWHANRSEVTQCEIDLRVGGRWRYAARTPDGHEFAFSGEYLEIVPDQRLVTTEIYEPIPDAGARTEMTLTEADGRTTMTMLVEHSTREHRDGHINSGMEAGMQDALDLAEGLAQELAA